MTEDDTFERRGNDIIYRAGVSYTQAALGAEIEIPTLDGKSRLKIPAGTQPGELLRMRGLGVGPKGGRRGDQIVLVDLKVPKKVGGRHRELLEELAEHEGKEGVAAANDGKGFFDRLKGLFE